MCQLMSPQEHFVKVSPEAVYLAAADMEREGPDFSVTWQTTTGDMVTLVWEDEL
jgi:hypothetical protein